VTGVIMIGENLPSKIVCPVCKGTNFTSKSVVLLVKRNVLTCNKCDTVMVQLGKGDKSRFDVRKVGEEFSNVDRLFRNKFLTIPELNSHEFPIVSDAQLEEYAKGNLEGLSIEMKGNLQRDIILKKSEKIFCMMSPIDYI
jgi:hypothetical protein